MAKSTFKSQNLNSNLEIDNLIAISNILRSIDSANESQNLLSNRKIYYQIFKTQPQICQSNREIDNQITKSTIKSQNQHTKSNYVPFGAP